LEFNLFKNEEIINKIVEPLEIRKIAPRIFDLFNNIGYRLIRVKKYEASTNTLQFMIERKNFEAITIKDCTKISKLLSELLEKNLKNDNYNIEVSSGGIERPLIEYKDFIRFIGRKIKIELKKTNRDKVKYLGILKKCEEGQIELIQDKTNKNIIFDFNLIKSANLVLEF